MGELGEDLNPTQTGAFLFETVVSDAVAKMVSEVLGFKNVGVLENKSQLIPEEVLVPQE